MLALSKITCIISTRQELGLVLHNLEFQPCSNGDDQTVVIPSTKCSIFIMSATRTATINLNPG
jgi:hypothetical protein